MTLNLDMETRPGSHASQSAVCHADAHEPWQAAQRAVEVEFLNHSPAKAVPNNSPRRLGPAEPLLSSSVLRTNQAEEALRSYYVSNQMWQQYPCSSGL